MRTSGAKSNSTLARSHLAISCTRATNTRWRRRRHPPTSCGWWSRMNWTGFIKRPQSTGMRAGRLLKAGVPLALLVLAVWPFVPWWVRVVAVALLVGVWTYSYVRYRAGARAETERQRELLRTANWETFSRVYNEQVVTIEEEFDVWG